LIGQRENHGKPSSFARDAEKNGGREAWREAFVPRRHFAEEALERFNVPIDPISAGDTQTRYVYLA